MTIDSRNLANWLVSAAIILWLLVVGRPLLVPLVFAILLWSVLNSLTDTLKRIGLAPWIAWASSGTAILAVLYLIARILGHEAAALASRGPVYAAKFEALAAGWLNWLQLPASLGLTDLLSKADAARVLGSAASSTGGVALSIALVAIYVSFLLGEQASLSAKIALLISDSDSREKGRALIGRIAAQIQAYLGVCTLLSIVMAVSTFALLTFLGIDFAGFWALLMFLLTYIPTIGGLGVLLPAAMAYVQSGSLETFLIIAISLSAMHFVLANIVQTLMLGQSLNLSSLAIMLSLSLWGLIWGVAGLFLAVPITATIALLCQHIDGLQWVNVALAGPPLRKKTRQSAIG